MRMPPLTLPSPCPPQVRCPCLPDKVTCLRDAFKQCECAPDTRVLEVRVTDKAMKVWPPMRGGQGAAMRSTVAHVHP